MKVWVAKLSGPNACPEVQLAKAPESIRHWNLAPVTVLANSKVAFWAPVVAGGVNVILVAGGPPW